MLCLTLSLHNKDTMEKARSMYNASASATLVKTWPKTIGVALVIILFLSALLINAYDSTSTPESKTALKLQLAFGSIGTVLSVIALFIVVIFSLDGQQSDLKDEKK